MRLEEGMTKFTIRTDVPPPRLRSKWGDIPWKTLEVGQSIHVETEGDETRRGINAIKGAIDRWGSKESIWFEREYVVQVDPKNGGFAIWRKS
jgi:hypothetical protein